MKALVAEEAGASALFVVNDEPGDAFYMVAEGRVRVMRQSGRTQRLIALLGPGHCFGELSLVRYPLRVASVQALGP